MMEMAFGGIRQFDVELLGLKCVVFNVQRLSMEVIQKNILIVERLNLVHGSGKKKTESRNYHIHIYDVPLVLYCRGMSVQQFSIL